jgi:hypothetical protein
MWMLRAILVLLPLAALNSQLHAEVFIEGHGANSCAFLNTNVRPGDGWARDAITEGVFSWVQGFMSGVNVVKREDSKRYFDLSAIGRDEQWAYVVEFCHHNPDRDISRAAADLMISRLRLISAPPPTKPAHRQENKRDLK